MRELNHFLRFLFNTIHPKKIQKSIAVKQQGFVFLHSCQFNLFSWQQQFEKHSTKVSCPKKRPWSLQNTMDRHGSCIIISWCLELVLSWNLITSTIDLAQRPTREHQWDPSISYAGNRNTLPYPLIDSTLQSISKLYILFPKKTDLRKVETNRCPNPASVDSSAQLCIQLFGGCLYSHWKKRL